MLGKCKHGHDYHHYAVCNSTTICPILTAACSICDAEFATNVELDAHVEQKVDCLTNCGAFVCPVTFAQYRASFTHYKEHARGDPDYNIGD